MAERTHLRALYGLMGSAFREAEALGFSWIGPEDFVLAILSSPEDSKARAALEHFGITHRDFAEALSSSIASADPAVDPLEEGEQPSMNPAAHQFMGRAEGIAVGFGAPAVTLEHVLIAYLWDDSGALEGFFSVKREAVLEHLGQLGVQVPEGPPPPPRRPSGPRIFVPFDDLMNIVDELVEHLPPGSGIGFNHDGVSRAWVSAYAEVDLAPYVAEVLDDLGLEPVPQPEPPSP